jgi:hypothetical protein
VHVGFLLQQQRDTVEVPGVRGCIERSRTVGRASVDVDRAEPLVLDGPWGVGQVGALGFYLCLGLLVSAVDVVQLHPS